jgi:hypothetical protein
MTISSTTAKNQYTANGAQTVFAYQFKVFAQSELEVYLGATLQVSGFAVSNTGSDTGGNVTFSVAPANGTIVTLKRRLPLVQQLDLPTQGAFPSDAVEQQFDRLVMMLLDLDERLGRTLLLSIASTLTGVSLPTPAPGKALGWNSTSDGLTNVEPASGALASAYMATVLAAANADAAQTALGIAPFAKTLFDDADAVTARQTLAIPGHNYAYNPDFGVAMFGTSFSAAAGATFQPVNNDGTILFNRWRLLSDGNDIVDVDAVSIDGKSAIRSVVQTANKRFGYFQIFESRDIKRLFDNGNGKASLSIGAWTTASKVVSKARAIVLSWQGGADSSTRDWVNAWNAQGSNPTPVASWTVEGSVEITLTTTPFTRYALEGVALDTAGTNNLGIFVMIDDTDATVNDELILSEVKFESGEKATPFQPVDLSLEELRCSRYGWVHVSPNTSEPIMMGWAATTSEVSGVIPFPVPMRTVPQVGGSNVAHYTILRANTSLGVSALTSGGPGRYSFRLNFTAASASLTVGEAIEVHHNSANGRLYFDAEI